MTSNIVEVLLRENALDAVWMMDNRRALCEYLLDYCADNDVTCPPDMVAFLEQAWNEEHGPCFTCDMLADCTCASVCDWEACHDHCELAAYHSDMEVVLTSIPGEGQEEYIQSATVKKVCSIEAAFEGDGKEVLILKMNHASVSVQEVHFEREPHAASWRCVPNPHITDKHAAERRQLELRRHLESGVLPRHCQIFSEEFVPLRTARLHLELRKKPLEAVHDVQDIMGSLVYFTCNECRVRFPAFHPKHVQRMKALKLEVPRHCDNSVAVWDQKPENLTLLASRCSGLCQMCADDLKKVANDDSLQGVTRFGRRNG
ncbi:MAG: hypothetical protein VX998_00675, partial [Candidatus Thermoplasmatota archaeon]|nr:hypothetical protein [Candidatus Thermoplasmatota archaeon]